MRALHYSVVTKRELSKKAKISIFKAVLSPFSLMVMNLGQWRKACDHKCKRPKWGFYEESKELHCLTRCVALRFKNLLTSSHYFFELKDLSLDAWFGHVSRMPQERLPKQALLAKANGRKPVGRPRTRWTDYNEDLGWNRLGLHLSEMMEVMEDHEVWRLNLKLLPPQPSRKSRQWRKKKQ